MFPKATLTALLILAVTVSASPVVIRDNLISLPFAKQINGTNAGQLASADRARAQALKRGRSALQEDAVISSPATNTAVSYVANVGVGSPATNYQLIIDTGSSNTWVGAGTAYKKTSTSTSTGKSVSVSYGSGSFSGTEYTDQVTLASGLVIPKQSIGAASRASGFDGVDGILGIGPVDLTSGTVSGTSTVPTVTDNLFSSGVISSNVVSVSFEPTTSESTTNGELTWGGTDSSKFTGSISYTPLTSTSPAREYWGINQSIKYGTSTTILSSTAGIVDTGTTLVLIATDAFKKYQSATGAVLDNNTGLLRITSSQYNNLQSLFFTTNGVTYEFTANAQLWPRALNTLIGGTANSYYLIVADLGSNSGEGLDFINGQTFLERFYSIYDTANKRVGFATTSFTKATTN